MLHTTLAALALTLCPGTEATTTARAVPGATAPVAATSMGAGPEWESDAEAALARAAEEGRVVLLALGAAGEGRSERHAKKVYGNKVVKGLMGQTLNVPAWSFAMEDKKKLPSFGGLGPREHAGNFGFIVEEVLRPNASGVVALPQHVWVGPDGKILLSCPFEMTALELAWCSEEALRQAGVSHELKAIKGAHPPRRLLMGETYRVLDADELGRGLTKEELKATLSELSKRFLTMGDRAEVIKVMFTDEDPAIDFLVKQFGLWEMAPRMEGVLDGTVGLAGLIAPVGYLEMLEPLTQHRRASLRAQVAVAYEQIGSDEGYSSVKKALSKEKDDAVRAEWARAVGASGRGNKSASKVLRKLVTEKEVPRVRRSAILALGYVLPEDGAREALVEQLTTGPVLDREAAILALGLARDVASREAIAKLAEDPELEGSVRATLGVFDGGNLSLLESAVARVTESEISRARVFFRSAAPSTNLGGRGR